jgi:hypothetical protein
MGLPPLSNQQHDAAAGRMRQVSPAGATTPEFTKLQAGRMEIAGDQDADDDRNYNAAAREYGEALELFEQYQKNGSKGELASARVHRKLAALKIAQEDYTAADSHITAAGRLLAGNEELSERASLNDLMAAEAKPPESGRVRPGWQIARCG